MSPRTSVLAAGAANLGIAIVKFAAAAASGSASMFSEGLHSLVDTIDQGLLLVGMHLARRPPDARHPFGHAQETYFWSTVVGMLIFGVGGGVSFYTGLRKLLAPAPLESAAWSYASLAVAFVFEGTSLVIGYRKLRQDNPRRGAWRALRDSKDPAVIAVVLEDSAAVIGLVIAATGVFLSHACGDTRFDAAAAMAIGLLLAIMASLLIHETRSLVVGESADPALVGRLRDIFTADPCVRRVGNILTMHLGPTHVLVNAQIQFREELRSSELERAIDRLEGTVKSACPIVKSIFVELESLSRADPSGDTR
jgi:cation diffusion facilitator family transporter